MSHGESSCQIRSQTQAKSPDESSKLVKLSSGTTTAFFLPKSCQAAIEINDGAEPTADNLDSSLKVAS